MQLDSASDAQLREWEATLANEYAAFKAAGLNLDLTRGKPSADQLNLSNALDGILGGNFKDEDSTDVRNYGGLDGSATPNQTVTFGPSWGPYDLSPDGALPEVSFTQHETITVWEENCCLAYADMGRLMCAERAQFIATLPNGNVRYHTYERMRGPLSVLVRLQFGKKIIAGFTANGAALKRRAENVAKQ